MDLIALDDAGRLYLSPDIDDWAPLEAVGVTGVIDLDGGLDQCVPVAPDRVLYLYYPINDAALPDCATLHAVGQFGATLVRSGRKVLVHCGLGLNRSALVAGMILLYLGTPAGELVAELRRRRPGALYNPVFADFLHTCAPTANG